MAASTIITYDIFQNGRIKIVFIKIISVMTGWYIKMQMNTPSESQSFLLSVVNFIMTFKCSSEHERGGSRSSL